MNRRTALLVAALPLVLAACGGASSPSSTHLMPDGTTMSGSAMNRMDHSGHSGDMTGDDGQGAGPSQAASMICGREIRGAVAHTLQIHTAPRGLHSFDHRLFRCSYLLHAGELRLSVKDLDTPGPGRAYFEALRSRLPLAEAVTGVESLGFPSFQTPHGDVAFLKDHKTLWVDASRLRVMALPSGMTRTEVAYGVAAAVVACWAE